MYLPQMTIEKKWGAISCPNACMILNFFIVI